MYTHMTNHAIRLRKTFTAYFTRMRLDAVVYSHMNLETAARRKTLITNLEPKRKLPYLLSSLSILTEKIILIITDRYKLEINRQFIVYRKYGYFINCKCCL